MLIFSKYLFHSNFNALAIWPFIFLKNRNLKFDFVLINHEKIHFEQQKEMLWFLFFAWYLVEFIIKIIIHKNWMKAYHSLSFEREAYKNEADLEYLSNRRTWSFLNYI